MRGSLAVYLVLLSVALLISDPTRAVPEASLSLYDRLQPNIHGISFFVLGLLAFAGAPAKYRGLLFVALLVYAGATELLQGLVPGRAIETEDLIQNYGGLLAGAAVAWMGAQVAQGIGLLPPSAPEV